ncbi:MAG TPA: hypothetical protein VLA72_21610 [Anaerolineales bacterium]|nr:hypothetical protein [Anaerolineales bacterium]
MTTELMQAFDFTSDDLAHNKSGNLSPRQLERYQKTSSKSRVVALFVTLAFGVGAYFTLLPFISQESALTENLTKLIGGIVLAGLSFFFLLTIFEKDKPVIKSARGKVQFISRESDMTHDDGTVTSSTSYYVVIGDEQFSVDSSQYQFFNQGHIYTIYREASILSRIVSIEYHGPPDG